MTTQQSSEANPILAEFVRGNMVENRHRGAFCLVDAEGNVVAQAGDINAAIFPRSAIKSLQALALFQSGAVDKFGLDDRDLALACASHLGEEVHVEGVTRFLNKIGMTADDLECGAHPPFSPAARKEMRSNGDAPTTLHNNCSGKHSGMLAVAKAIGADPKGYIEKDHPVQVLVRECVERVLGVSLTPDQCGRDGCSIPTWGAPLVNFASAFAKLSAGSNQLSAIDARAGERLFAAAASNAELVSGTGGFDTDAMNAFAGQLMVKIGADGVFCGAIRGRNLGFALKCDDGNKDASEAMVAALIKNATPTNEAQNMALDARLHKTAKNWRGFEVGHHQASEVWAQYF